MIIVTMFTYTYQRNLRINNLIIFNNDDKIIKLLQYAIKVKCVLYYVLNCIVIHL